MPVAGAAPWGAAGAAALTARLGAAGWHVGELWLGLIPGEPVLGRPGEGGQRAEEDRGAAVAVTQSAGCEGRVDPGCAGMAARGPWVPGQQPRSMAGVGGAGQVPAGCGYGWLVPGEPEADLGAVQLLGSLAKGPQ